MLFSEPGILFVGSRLAGDRRRIAFGKHQSLVQGKRRTDHFEPGRFALVGHVERDKGFVIDDQNPDRGNIGVAHYQKLPLAPVAASVHGLGLCH